MHPSNGQRRHLWPACDRLGAPRIEFHAFRRGETTRHIREGVDPKTAQAILGNQYAQTSPNHHALADAAQTRRVVEACGISCWTRPPRSTPAKAAQPQIPRLS